LRKKQIPAPYLINIGRVKKRINSKKVLKFYWQHLVGTLFDQYGRFRKEEKEIGAQQETNPGALSDQYRKG